jgi:hypothetical protein
MINIFTEDGNEVIAGTPRETLEIDATLDTQVGK